MATETHWHHHVFARLAAVRPGPQKKGLTKTD
jgi:hypothetical protein